MLEVKSVQSKEEQRRLCGLCGAEYDADTMAYAAWEGGAFLGLVQFGISVKDGYIKDIALVPDFFGVADEVKFMLGRAAMNFLDICRIKNVYYDAADKASAATLGFTERGGRYRVNLEGFFVAPCDKGRAQKDKG